MSCMPLAQGMEGGDTPLMKPSGMHLFVPFLLRYH